MAQNLYDLSNHALRARALETFFTAKGIRGQFGRISNQGNWFELELNETNIDVNSVEFNGLLAKLNETCGTHLPLQIIFLQQALQAMINEATSNNVFNPTACNALLTSPCFNFESIDFEMISGQLTVPTASPDIANLFTTLQHAQLVASNLQLGIKLYDYLSAKPAGIFLVYKGNDQQPSLFLNNEFFPREQVLLSEEPQADGSIQITPYMLVAQPTTPPEYHFILDRSTSMDGDRLITAKASLLHFATILFQFEPRARLSINLFNSDSVALRAYSFVQADLMNGTLRREINSIVTSGGTNIAKACLMKMREFLNNQNNVLLFTDGDDTTTDHARLAQELNNLSPEQKVKNKFFIISFVKQQEVLEELTRAFGSEFFIETTTQIQEVLANHQQLQTWAASRDLFTTRVQIVQSINGETINIVFTNAMMQSNQVEALTAFNVQPGDEVHVEVRDSFNRALLTAHQVVGSIAVPPNSPVRERPLSPGSNSIFHHDTEFNNVPVAATLDDTQNRASLA